MYVYWDFIVKFFDELLFNKSLGINFFIKFLLIELSKFIMIPFIYLISIPLFLYNYRVVKVFESRIGHLFSETEYLLKSESLNLNIYKYKYILPLNANKVPNKYFIDFISRHFYIPSSFFTFFFRQLSHSKLVGIDATIYFKNSINHKKAYEISHSWGNKSPVFKHSENEFIQAKRLLYFLGVKDFHRYVVVNSRSNLGFYDDKIQEYRNCSLHNFYLAIEYLFGNGFDVIIAGNFDRSSLKKLPKKIINYTDSKFQSDINDILVCSNATFFLGSSSGLFHIANSFHIPCGLSNMVPPSSTPLRADDCFIPKLIFDTNSYDFLTLEDIYRYESKIFPKGEFRSSNFIITENLPEDILILAEALISQDPKLFENTCNLFPDNVKFNYNLAKMPIKFFNKYSVNKHAAN